MTDQDIFYLKKVHAVEDEDEAQFPRSTILLYNLLDSKKPPKNNEVCHSTLQAY